MPVLADAVAGLAGGSGAQLPPLLVVGGGVGARHEALLGLLGTGVGDAGVGLRTSVTVAPTVHVLHPAVLQEVGQPVLEVALPDLGDVLADARHAGDDDVVEAHADLPVAWLGGLVLGPLAVELRQVLGNAAGVVQEAVLLLQTALVEPDGGPGVPQYAVHLGAGRVSLAETPLLAAGPVTDLVGGVGLGEVPLYHGGRTALGTLQSVFEIQSREEFLSCLELCAALLERGDIDYHNAVDDYDCAENAEMVKRSNTKKL